MTSTDHRHSACQGRPWKRRSAWRSPRTPRRRVLGWVDGYPDHLVFVDDSGEETDLERLVKVKAGLGMDELHGALITAGIMPTDRAHENNYLTGRQHAYRAEARHRGCPLAPSACSRRMTRRFCRAAW